MPGPFLVPWLHGCAGEAARLPRKSSASGRFGDFSESSAENLGNNLMRLARRAVLLALACLEFVLPFHCPALRAHAPPLRAFRPVPVVPSPSLLLKEDVKRQRRVSEAPQIEPAEPSVDGLVVGGALASSAVLSEVIQIAGTAGLFLCA